jgi:hypothetical protein
MTFRTFVIAIGVLTCSVAANAQGQIDAKSIPLRVELVISRYQGERKVSSVPYTFVVNATDPANPSQEPSRVRMGVELPVAYPPTAEPKPGVAPGEPPPPYKAFGTNIDCFARALDGGRFKLGVTVEESSPFSDQDKARLTASPGDGGALRSSPVFRSYRLSNTLVLKDGQSQQFSAVTDRFTGEVVKMDLMMSVIK